MRAVQAALALAIALWLFGGLVSPIASRLALIAPALESAK